MTGMDIKVYVDIQDTQKLLRVRINNDVITVLNKWGNPLVIFKDVGSSNQSVDVVCSGYTMRHYMQKHEEYSHVGYVAESLRWENFRELLELELVNLLKEYEHD